MTATVRKIVHKNNSVHWIIEDTSRVFVTYRAADVPQFNKVRALGWSSLLVLMQPDFNGASNRPAGGCQRFIMGYEVGERSFANT